MDPWCQKNCDSDKEPDLKDINTEVCEQLMRRVNKHLNCKSMNQATYFMFWFYMFDLQNLDMVNMAST